MTAHTQDRIHFASAGAVRRKFEPTADGSLTARQIEAEREPDYHPRKPPTIRTAFADLLVALADNHPVNIIGEADAADMEERAEHVQAVLGAVETYLTAVLADAKHRTSGVTFDVNVTGILSDTRGDLVGTFRIAAEQMRELERDFE